MGERKLKVLFLVNIPSPYRVDFFNELGTYCELTVLFEKQLSTERNEDWHKSDFTNFVGIFLSGIKIRNSILCTGISRYLKKGLFDIIVVGGYSTATGIYAIHLLRLRKISFIINTDGGMINQEVWTKYIFKKYLISSAAHWLSTGESATKYLLHYGAKEENIFFYPFTSIYKKDVVAKPIEPQTKIELKKKHNLTAEKVVISVGSFIARKGFDTLIRASVNLPVSYGVYIVGGTPTPEYIKLIEQHSLTNIHFIDFKKKEELMQLYMASDLFVLPTRDDIWGLVINEAMASGLPIITTNNCGAGLELVKDYENGFIVETNSENQLSERIEEILGNSSLSADMGNNGINKIQRYTIENMAIEHLSIFNTIADKDRYNGH